MSMRMSDEEVWEFLESGHTAVLTTLRSDGWPVALPLWYVVDSRSVFVATPETSKKVVRIRNDDRASLLAEHGRTWTELAAVEIPVRAKILEPGAEAERAGQLFAAKYSDQQLSRA